MSNPKRDVKANSTTATQPTGLSLQGSQINLTSRLSNFNISNPLHYLYNENADSVSRGRPMSASTLGATYQESPRRSRLVKRPQSADTINKIAKSRHITFDFSHKHNDSGLGNHHRVGLENTFDELDADELSSSDGSSTPALLQDDDDRPQNGIDRCDRPALEPGLTSKPPIPPVGNGSAVSPDPSSSSFADRDAGCSSHKSSSSASAAAVVTFDDAIELKFQRWFPNSAPIETAVPTEAAAGVSYEYSERVIDNDRGTVTYTRSSSSMSIRGSQDQLDEEHLYSNLSAAIGGADKFCRGSVSVDMLDVLRNDDNRRTVAVPASMRPRPKKKKTTTTSTPVAAVTHKVKRDVPKSVLKSRTNPVSNPAGPVTAATCKTKSGDDVATACHEQQAPEKESARNKDHPSRKIDDSPVDYTTEDVVSWMSSHQLRPSETSELDDTFASLVDDKHCDAFRRDHKTSTYDEIVNILKELESENNDIGS